MSIKFFIHVQMLLHIYAVAERDPIFINHLKNTSCILLKYIGTADRRMFLIYNSFSCCHTSVDGNFKICLSNSLGDYLPLIHKGTLTDC